MLGFIIGIPLYLLTGYIFGKILNNEYCNDTPTQDLGLWRKLKRIYLFPISYHNWAERSNIHNTRSPAASLRDFCTEGKQDTKKLENYCELLMFVWPLSATFNVVLTIPEILAYTCWKFSKVTYTLISCQYNLTNKLAKKLAYKTRKFLPVNTTSYIRELEQFKDIELQESKTKFLTQKGAIQTRVEKIKEVLEEWRSSRVLENSGEIIKDTISTLEKEFGEGTEKLKGIDSRISNLKEHEDSIEDALKKLKLSLKTTKLKIQIINNADTGFIKGDALAELISQLISSTQTSMQFCRGMNTEKIV